MAGLEETQAGIKIAGRNINNLTYAYDTTLMAESEEELKSLLMKVKEWKSWLKAQHSENEDHGIQSDHFMGKKWGNSGRLNFGGLQNHCRWWWQPWNKQMLIPWKESYDQPRQHIKKQRHYFAKKCPSSQSYGFPSSHVWMWEFDHKESWAPNNWYFWILVLENSISLRVSWTARRVNQSILKEITPEYSLEELILKLKLQYLGHLMQRTDSL